MTSRFCPECYSEIPEGVKVCPCCSAPLITESSAPKKQSTHTASMNNDSELYTEDLSKNMETKLYTVRLSGNIVNKLHAIKLVREVTGLGLVDAKNLVESDYPIIAENVSSEKAKNIAQKFLSASIESEIVASDGTLTKNEYNTYEPKTQTTNETPPSKSGVLNILFPLIGFLLPLVGLILFFVKKKENAKLAKVTLVTAIIGIITNLVINFWGIGNVVISGEAASAVTLAPFRSVSIILISAIVLVFVLILTKKKTK